MNKDHSDPMAACEHPENDPNTTREAEGPIQTSHHRLTLLPGMAPILNAIAHDVDEARARVAVETYVYRGDKLGRSFADALARAAKRKIPTRLLYDPLGSQETDPAFFEEMRERGIEIRSYRPPSTLLGEGSLWPRDHSRIIVIDENAYTGGAAWGDEWLPRPDGGAGWHDVCLRVEGPVVEDFAALFEQRWLEANAEISEPRDYSTGNKYPDLELLGDAPTGKTRVYDRYRSAVQRAKHRIWIENAYFFPPYGLAHDLGEAAARGVDVQIIVPGITDLPTVKHAARAEMPTWLERGIRVFEYQRCMLHAKFAVFDDDLCTIGTFNINPTSLGFANEVNLFVSDKAFVHRVADLFLADRALSAPITQEILKERPLTEQFVDELAHGALSVVDRLVDRSSS